MFKPRKAMQRVNTQNLKLFQRENLESRSRGTLTLKTAFLAERDSGILLALNLWHRTGFGGQVRPDSVSDAKTWRCKVTCLYDIRKNHMRPPFWFYLCSDHFAITQRVANVVSYQRLWWPFLDGLWRSLREFFRTFPPRCSARGLEPVAWKQSRTA